MSAMDLRHLNQVQLSRRWSISPRTLERWRWLKAGPRYLKIGGRVVYRLEDVEAFEQGQLYLSEPYTDRRTQLMISVMGGSYLQAAIEGESANVAGAQSSTRNHALNRAAFKLGTIPNMPTDTATNALLLASGANGYMKEHGESATRKVIESGLRNGQANLRPIKRDCNAVARRPNSLKLSTTTKYPTLTKPDANGKPSFRRWGADGPPPRADQKRRHIYIKDSEPVRIKVMLQEGGAVNWYRVQDDLGNIGWQARKPAGYVEVPYTGGADPFHPEVSDDILFLPEGEKDCDTLVSIGLLAMTFGGTGDGAPTELASYCLGRRIVILADNDEGGRNHAERKAVLAARSAKEVRVVTFPELPEKGDVSDWIALGHTADDLRTRAEAAPPWTEPPGPAPKATAGRRLISHRASDLTPEKLVWIWPGRIPEGKLVLLGGPPGLGKSQLTAFISAVVSNGLDWPCGEGPAPQGNVLFMSAEDGIQDTIVPRLMAAGADLDRVNIVAAATKMDGTGRKTFSLKTDVDLLEALAQQIGNVRLIIVDPISAYMGGADGNGNVETREVLEPLAEMANRLRIAVVAVTHLNKGGAGNQNAVSRFAGSIAFIAAARAAFAVIEDPDDEGRRLLLQAKTNLGKKCEGLAFRIEQRLVADDILTSNIMFEGAHVSASIDEALSASESRGSGEKGTSKDEAANFLRTVLVGGALPVLQIESEAREAGLLGPDSPISQNKAFRSARKELCIDPQRQGGTGAKGQWVWGLPIREDALSLLRCPLLK